MRKDSLFHRFLIKIGFIKEAGDINTTNLLFWKRDQKTKQKLCEKAIASEFCPGFCDICPWDYRE